MNIVYRYITCYYKTVQVVGKERNIESLWMENANNFSDKLFFWHFVRSRQAPGGTWSRWRRGTCSAAPHPGAGGRGQQGEGDRHLRPPQAPGHSPASSSARTASACGTPPEGPRPRCSSRRRGWRRSRVSAWRWRAAAGSVRGASWRAGLRDTTEPPSTHPRTVWWLNLVHQVKTIVTKARG